MELTQGEKHYFLFVWNALHDKGLTTDKVLDLKERTTNYGLYKFMGYINTLNFKHTLYQPLIGSIILFMCLILVWNILLKQVPSHLKPAHLKP